MGEAHMLREHRLGELQSSRSDPLGDDDDLLLVAGVPPLEASRDFISRRPRASRLRRRRVRRAREKR